MSRKTPRLSRADWLVQALEILAREGESQVRVVRLCQAMGVTQGSFYWHFESRSDFMNSLLDYWSVEFTERVARAADEGGGSAEERLYSVLRIVTDDRLSRFDSAFDSWAAHEPGLTAKISRVYRFRYDYVGGLFREMGFRGIDLHTRTAAFLGFVKSELTLSGRSVPKKRSRQRLRRELAFFTRMG